MALTATRLQIEIEPRNVAQLDHRGRYDRKHHRITYLTEGAKGPPRKSLHTLVRFCTLFPVLELDKGQTHVLPVTGETEADHSEHGIHDVCFLF